MESLLQDVRYGARMLWKSPGFTLVAIAVLALGIGGTSTMFSVVNAVLLRPLPFADSDRLVYLAEESKQLRDMSISYPDFLDWRDQNQVLERIGVMQPASFNLSGGDRPEVLSGKAVTEGFFPTLGVKAMLGRVFTPEDDRPESGPVAVISYRLWQRSLGGDPNIVGRAVTLSDKTYTVIGVLPKGFEIPGQDDDVYVSLGALVDADLLRRGAHPGIYGFARLKPGITVERAKADLDTIARRLASAYPLSNAGIGVNLQGLQENVVGDTRKPLIVLFAAVGCVLLIVCANVTNLLLARATSRRKEISIRRALGAGRLRIVRQLLTESMLLSLAGGALGIGLAVWVTRAAAGVANRLLQFTADISVDSRVLGFTVAVSALTGIIFGLAPALHSSSESLNETLKEGGRTSSIGSRQWMRNALVVTEVALSLVLLIGAGLLIRSFARLREVNPGFDSRNVLTAMIALPQNRYPDDAHRRQFYTQALGEIQRLPGVVSAGTITPLPLTGMGWQNDYRIEGRPVPAAGEFPNTDMHYVSPSYLDTMRIPLQRGRQFSEADGENSLPVVLVNQTFAQRWFPNEDALGKRVRLCGSCEGRDMKRFPWYTIVGVVSDVRQYGLDAQPKTEVYVSYLQAPRGFTFFVVRTAGDPMALADSLRAGIQRVDKDQPVFGVRSMEQLVDRSLSVKKASMFLLAVFATVALLLAAIGIYGVISYTVGQRTQEIGIRMALGARRVDVLKMVVGQGFSIAAIGLGVGLMLALALTRLIRSLLFEVRATDPVTFIGLLVVLGSVALLACVIPAQRATRVEPVTALRYE